MKKKNIRGEYVYNQAITDVPNNIKNLNKKIKLYETAEKVKIISSLGYSPKHNIMRIRFEKFDIYPYDYIYMNITPKLFYKIYKSYGGFTFRNDVVSYISKYPCYRLDAKNSKAKVLPRPVFKEKELAIGNRIKHWILGQGTIIDMYDIDKETKKEIYRIEFDNKENNVDYLFYSNELELIK